MTPEIDETVAERFWRNVDRTSASGPNGDCWQWIGGLLRDSKYPRGFSIKGKSYRPSHIALALVGASRPSADMEALHQCDYPPCVNPAHLRWGTHEENHTEALERRKPSARCLAPDVVREIRASTERNFEIARRLGVTQGCICQIRKRVTHKHIA